MSWFIHTCRCTYRGPRKTSKPTFSSQLDCSWEVQCRREKTPLQICYFRGQQPTEGKEQCMGSLWVAQSKDRIVSSGDLREVSLTGSGCWLQKSGHWRGCHILSRKVLSSAGQEPHATEQQHIPTCIILLSTQRVTTVGYSPVSGSIANPRNYEIRSQTLPQSSIILIMGLKNKQWLCGSSGIPAVEGYISVVFLILSLHTCKLTLKKILKN